MRAGFNVCARASREPIMWMVHEEKVLGGSSPAVPHPRS